MAFRVKLAEPEAELDGVACLRHRVFVDDEKFFSPRPDGRLRDRWDGAPVTGNIIAIVDGEVVGNVRFVEDGALRTPPDEYFEVAPHLPAAAFAPGACLGGGSSLLVTREARRLPRLSFSMMAMGYAWCVFRGLTHVKGAANPAIMAVLEATGWRQIAPTYLDRTRGLQVAPVFLALAEVKEGYASFIKRHLDGRGRAWLERRFHAPGESLLAPALSAGEQLQIIAGTVVAERDGRMLASSRPASPSAIRPGSLAACARRPSSLAPTWISRWCRRA